MKEINMKEYIWNKSIRNSLIASFWFLILSQLAIFVWTLFSKIKFIEAYQKIFAFLNISYCIKGWIYVVIGTILLIIIFLFIKYKIKSGKEKKNDADTESQKTIEQEPLEIRDAPTVFFHHRFCDAFPGTEDGVTWFKNKRDINRRLQILLQTPTRFDIANGHGLTTDPIWWYRGGSGLYINRFRILSWEKVLLNSDEYKVEKIAAYRGHSYFRDFVYVQCLPDKATGLYKHDPNVIESYIKENNEYTEEFGIYQGRLITRQEYDDGSSIIKGKPVKISGAELRSRALTKYNFIITSKFSPYNCKDFNRYSEEYFIKLLNDEIQFDDFIEWMEKFPKNIYDY